MIEPPWKRRYRVSRSTFPTWARERADRLVYLSNHTGKFEIFAWDRAAGKHRQVTDRPDGTGYRVPAWLEPDGERIWWWNDRKGDEFGTWTVEAFDGSDRREAAPLEPSYSTGLALGRTFAVIGRSTSDEGSTAYLVPHDDRPLRIYAHREMARIGDVSTDEELVVLAHAEHGDSRNPAVRVIDVAGNNVAELWDGPGRGLWPAWWSPVRGDRRLLVTHERQGIGRPLILDARSGAASEVEVDLPGEVDADWYPDGRALLLGHEHRGRTELYRYDVSTQTLTRGPESSQFFRQR